MYILRNEKNKNSSLAIPLERPGSYVTHYTLEHALTLGDNRLPTVDGAPGRLLLAPNANYHIQGDWVFGSGTGSGFQHIGSFSHSVVVAANGTATVTGSFKYNETFAGMDLTIVQNTAAKRPEIVIRTYVWGGMVTRALVHLKVVEIVRNSQL